MTYIFNNLKCYVQKEKKTSIFSLIYAHITLNANNYMQIIVCYSKSYKKYTAQLFNLQNGFIANFQPGTRFGSLKRMDNQY